MREEMKFEQIFAGEVHYITRVKVAAGEYKRGDLLECVVTSGAMASTYGQCATASTVKMDNVYVVCANNCTAEANDEVVVYREGFFNKALIMLKGKEANDAAVEILKAKNIFLETVK